MMPDPTTVVNTAANAGWMPALLAFVFIVVIGFLVWLVKKWIDIDVFREQRLAAQINSLEQFIQIELVKLIDQCRMALENNTAASSTLTSTLASKPCLLPDQREKWTSNSSS